MIDEIAGNNAQFTAWRQDIHQHPELGFEEQRTAKLVTAKRSPLVPSGCAPIWMPSP